MVCVSFLGVQAADGVCSYVGLRAFGIGIEANPLIAWYAAAFGIGVALTGAKVLAATCALILHYAGMHRTIGLLTILYLRGAVWPWTQILLW